MPVSQAILGHMPDVAKLRDWLKQSAEGELRNSCEPVAIAAEVIESRSADRDEYFLDDDRVRNYVFHGAKWKAGWVLTTGSAISDEFVERLGAAQYLVFTTRPDGKRDQVSIPGRETGAIYFLQMMVRYAMIWGQIPPGQDHEMGHFLERDMPGAMVVRGEIGPVEGLLLLALMKMGCPAVVDANFPYDIGPRAVARNDDEMMKALGRFPNMRVRIVDGQEFSLPGGADPVYSREIVQPERVVSGLFQLRPGDGASGIVVSGNESAEQVVFVVEVSDEELDLPISAHLEAEAIRFGSYLPGVKTRRDDDGTYRVELAEGVALDSHLLGEVIHAGLKRKYPRIGSICVRIAFGQETLDRELAIADVFNQERDRAILAESEETVEAFHLCIDCQPFSHMHVCVITPDRPPMCNRSRNEIKAGALWGADYRPWTRRDVGGQDLQYTIAKGEAIDEVAGEWVGINVAAKTLTGGKVERVRIHSVCETPHTSCGCFAALAFKIPGIDGIGVMHRGYKGLAPGELTWFILANRAGGKQASGVTGITLEYLKSPKAFAGEGGLSAVKWATKKVFDIMATHLPASTQAATEEQATTLAGLKAFLSVQ